MGKAEGKRVLLAWERGAGFGHTTQLARIGRRLAAEGAEVCAAVPHRALSTPLEAAGIPLRDAPPWPAPPPRPDDHLPAGATFTDGLAAAGLREPACIRSVLQGWRAVLDEMRPDLVICNYAPLAGLAARGRARVMHLGTGYYTPPDGLEAMPLLQAMPLRHSDAEILAALNTALEAESLPALARIGALFAGDDTFLSTFVLLDPYADHRQRDADGPLFEEPPLPRRAQAHGIFAYLHADVVTRPGVHAALCRLGTDLDLRTDLDAPALLAPLAAAGVRLHLAPLRVAPMIAGARLVLHQGSAGMAADAIAAGVPQFAICDHLEHYLNAAAVEGAGLGRMASLRDPAAGLDAGRVRAAMADPDLAFMAEVAGRIHRQLLADWPLDHLARRCLALL